MMKCFVSNSPLHLALQFPNDVYSVLFRGKIVLDGKDKATLNEVIALLCNLFTSSHCLQ